MNEFDVLTNHPVALESVDHLHPMGTMRDNYSNPAFNKKLWQAFRRSISVMDIGCAGGGFVQSLIDEGHTALGLEGSDYSKKNKRACWNSIPSLLFTCDATKPFHVVRKNAFGEWVDAVFDVITLWDVFEHFREEELPQVFYNISQHLPHGGLLICTVADSPSPNEYEPGIDMHPTQKPQDWWVDVFHRYGFGVDHALIEHFDKDWVRYVSSAYVLRKGAWL